MQTEPQLRAPTDYPPDYESVLAFGKHQGDLKPEWHEAFVEHGEWFSVRWQHRDAMEVHGWIPFPPAPNLMGAVSK